MSIKSITYSNFSVLLLVLAGMLGGTAVQAQAPGASPNPAANWPSRAVRVIVAATPGGGTDVLARLFAQRLQERLAQPFVVENRGGNGGSIAASSPFEGGSWAAVWAAEAAGRA
jgi:tripartite-type tricarboxylate transporter receptor subunit TctC